MCQGLCTGVNMETELREDVGADGQMNCNFFHFFFVLGFIPTSDSFYPGTLASLNRLFMSLVLFCFSCEVS